MRPERGTYSSCPPISLFPRMMERATTWRVQSCPKSHWNRPKTGRSIFGSFVRSQRSYFFTRGPAGLMSRHLPIGT